jgi:1,4-alpha-glucan branching enzyme
MVNLGRTGEVTFIFRCNTQRQVYLVGDFNLWDPVATPMRRGEDGLWYATLDLSPGRHEFRYYEEGGVWHSDFAAFGVARNEFGSFNSIVEVAAPTPARLRVAPANYPFSGSRQLT